jgi:hypothetical protein
LCTSFRVFNHRPTVTKKVVGVFVRFRAPLQLGQKADKAGSQACQRREIKALSGDG